jgi:hypothetical protein
LAFELGYSLPLLLSVDDRLNPILLDHVHSFLELLTVSHLYYLLLVVDELEVAVFGLASLVFAGALDAKLVVLAALEFILEVPGLDLA